MKKKIYIDVPEPCHENWQEMTPIEQGRHCGVCTKNVIDFTRFTDKELLDFLSTPQQNICGRFDNKQLNRAIEYPITQQKYSLPSSWLFGLSLLAWTIATALPITTYAAPIVVEQSVLKGEIKNTDGDSSRTIRGIVTDSLNNENLAFVSIRVKETKIRVATDYDGKFTLKIPKSFANKDITLEIRYVGYETKHIIVKPNETLVNVALSEDVSIFMGEVMHVTMGRMSDSEYLTQKRVYGKIVSEEDSTPVAGATVFLSNRNHRKTIFGDTTDAEGNYSFDLPLNYNDSVFSIRFEKEGKTTKIIEGIIHTYLKKPLNTTLNEKEVIIVGTFYEPTRWQKVKRFFKRLF